MACLNKKHSYHFRIKRYTYTCKITSLFSFYLFAGKKPGEITVRTKEGPHLYTPGIILPKLYPTPTTDITDEITERKSFDKLHTFRHTPDPYLHHLRDNNEKDQEDSDPMNRGRKENGLLKVKSTSTRASNKRSIGTMPEPLQTRNFGNRVQPPNFGIQVQPHSSEINTYSEEKSSYQPPLYLQSNGHHKSGSSSPLNGHNKIKSPPSNTHNYAPPSIGGSPPQTPPTKKPNGSSSGSRSPPFLNNHVSPPNRTPTTTTPKDPPRPPLSSSENSSPTVKKQRSIAPAETDTSLDGINHSNHHINPPKPLEKRDSGTTSSSSIKRTQSEYQKSNSSSPKHSDHHPTTSHRDDYPIEQDENPPSSRKIYRLRPNGKDPYVSNYEPNHSDHRQITSPKDDYKVGRDEPSPSSQKIYRLRPTKPGKISITSISSSKASDDDFPKPISDDSTPASPRHPNGQPKISPIRRNHDHVDNNGKITPSSLNHAQKQRIPSRTNSPVLSIATERIIHQSSNNEYATPIETSYVDEPNPDFPRSNSSPSKHETSRSNNKKMILLPVINSSRTYVFEKQSTSEKNIRQSKLNGNFYLATSPALRSLNSSYQANDSRINRSTNAIDEDDFTGQHLGTQMA